MSGVDDRGSSQPGRGAAVDPDLLCRLPGDARLVLHVGCGAGALGAEYKRRNPRAQVIGIEADPAAAEAAEAHLDAVYAGDLEEDPTPFAADVPRGGLDCIVYEGALGACRDPWGLLRLHAPFLAEDGTLLLRTGNPAHWRVLAGCLTDAWAPDAPGVLRVNAPAVRAGVRHAGLVPVDCTPLAADPASGAAVIDAMLPALQNLGLDPAAYEARATPAGHLWRARWRPVAERLTLVSTMLSPIGGVSEVRVAEPMQAMKADPSLDIFIISNTDDPPPNIDGPRVFIFHRPLLAGDHGLERVHALIRAGWVVVCEFDDHPDYIPVLQRPDIQNFRAVHAIQTTTEPLSRVLAEHNPEITIFGNAVARLPEPRNFTRDDRLSLFFAGLNREGEWPPYIDALNAVAARFQGRLHFEVLADRGFFDALRTPHKSFTPLCDYGLYQELLARCEISFMPLLDTPFNRCKSDLKFIEAAAHRLVALAGDVVYPDSIADGQTGVLFRSPEELGQRLSRLVASPEIARAIGDAARAHVRETRMLAYQVADRAAWYRALWERREELHRALAARVPEFAGAVLA